MMLMAIMILICVTIALMIWNLIGEIRMQKRLENGLRAINKRVKRLEANNEMVITMDSSTVAEAAADMAQEHDNTSDTASDGDV